MDSRDNPRPRLPVMQVYLVDKALRRFALILEADLRPPLRLGVDFDYAEINPPLSWTPRQPDMRFLGPCIHLCFGGFFSRGSSLSLR